MVVTYNSTNNMEMMGKGVAQKSLNFSKEDKEECEAKVSDMAVDRTLPGEKKIDELQKSNLNLANDLNVLPLQFLLQLQHPANQDKLDKINTSKLDKVYTGSKTDNSSKITSAKSGSRNAKKEFFC
ncbi:hypothetical protein AV530_016528 [Patagioenas fasciata monilis]|uniref:Uncharacterized protein n=1 Tax=Patagioenas fasciata monilis TaxID=372326 RepID=A0A1V4J2F1_PATFA|nr:hypothetical protein AV530_016528 [Patagioenas fasciata monilis]